MVLHYLILLKITFYPNGIALTSIIFLLHYSPQCGCERHNYVNSTSSTNDFTDDYFS